LSEMSFRGVLQSDASYKRGVILGLTMAEAVLLLLFSLLLALAAMFLDQEKKSDRIVQDRDNLKKEVHINKQKLEAAMRVIGQSDTKEMKKELIRLESQEQKIAVLLKKLNFNEKVVNSNSLDTLVARVTKLNETTNIIKEAGLPSDPHDLKVALEEVKNERVEVEAAKKAEQQARREKEKIAKKLNAAESKLKDAQLTEDRLKGKVASIERMMGKGTEKPACWADKATGKPKYIFNVGLTNEGIIVRHSATPPFSKAENLPIDSIPYDRVLKPREFRSLAKPIFDWSENKECRFFVRAWDRTGEREKTRYKRHKRFLETRFYAYEVLNDPWK
jgi:type II secretory pathway component PulJ